MKTRFFILLMGFTSLLVHAGGLSDNDSPYIRISGIVRDKLTREVLPYAAVALRNQGKGTVTNEEGRFTLVVEKEMQHAEIEVSHIGYLNLCLPLSEEGGEIPTIWMTPTTRLLHEVVVRGGQPRELVETAMRKIPENYSRVSTMLTGFYRETAQKRNRYINISEAVVDIQKSPYDKDVSRDKVRILKGRRLVSPKIGDTLAVKLLGGPTNAIYLDIVKNPDLLLDKEVMAFYDYHIEEMVFIDKRPQFVIRFTPNTSNFPYALYKGKLYIDQERISITRAEFYLDLKDRQKATEAILHRKPFGLRFRPLEVAYLINYVDRGDCTYLNYMRSKIRFKCDWKRKLFATPYTILAEMVVTDIRKTHDKIPYREKFDRYQIFSDRASHFFDRAFWEHYNIIEPDESLDKAVHKLKKQYSP